MRLFRDHGPGALRFQHPDRYLQSPPTWIQNANGPVTSLWSAKDLQGGTMERVKWVEDPNTRFIRAQGIVGVGVTIRTFIVSSPAAACQRMVLAGSPADPGSSCLSASSPVCSDDCFSNICKLNLNT
jgi:hypothetical protein